MHYFVASYLPRLLYNGLSVALLPHFYVQKVKFASYFPQSLQSIINLDNGISVTLLPKLFVQKFFSLSCQYKFFVRILSFFSRHTSPFLQESLQPQQLTNLPLYQSYHSIT